MRACSGGGLFLTQVPLLRMKRRVWQKQSGWTVHRVWMAHSTTRFGNQRTPSLIFASVSPTKVSHQLRRRKRALSTLGTPCTSEFIAMTLNLLGSSQPNYDAT